ncbi:MgtC/SapB family protein [Roseomonas sp. OT10]|uniref:MgtC/SapB family protein n=1 Tax=Roseomonas cutis TaxID=2897332 RepID=UPI001E4C0CC7|nr:MgtC/SapB family protein [Roseomonas sp. OT10]UFN49670.1 MgtC/SapB family protein [Roseomonas sp. OT10]
MFLPPMTPGLGWEDAALRLALTVLAGALIGLNRDMHGRPAGLRTTLLVALAAALAMLLAHALQASTGKGADSFVSMDVLRLPLGILTGMGFLGAGAILRRGDMVRGLTTAATLWVVTVIGLCFGAGQIALGLAGTVLVLLTLWALKQVEAVIRRDHRATLVLETEAEAPAEALERQLAAGGYRVAGLALRLRQQGRLCRRHYDLRWRGPRDAVLPPAFLRALAGQDGVRLVQWLPEGSAEG